MKRKSLVVLTALILCVAMLAGCGASQNKPAPSTSASSSSAPAPSESGKTTFGLKPLEKRETLRVGFFSGSPHSIPFYIADKEGFWDELNIDIQYESFINGPAMMEANKTWDIADTGGPGVLVGQLGHGLKMVGVADYESNLALFARPDSPIVKAGKGKITQAPELYGTAAEWKGTKWLYPIGTNLHMTLADAVGKVGLKMSDIESVNMDVTSALTAFKGGEADGLAVWNAIAFAAEDAGFVRIADAGSLDVVSLCGLVATPDALANKKELITKAWQVYYLTWNWAKSSPENMAKAEAYFYESCQEEGVASSEAIAKKSLALYRAPSPKDAIAVMTETEADYLGKYTSRQLLKSENGLLQTLDFFIAQDKYKDADRVRLLDGKLVDSTIAEAAKADFAAQGIELK